MLTGRALEVLIETTKTPESTGFNRILQEQGTRAALSWRDKKINNPN